MATVLVVDDDPSARELLTAVLAHAGHDCLEAAEGDQALQRLEAQRPDLIIIDLLMPGMDGVQLVQALRRRTATRAIPVVFHTAAYLESEMNPIAHACGVDHVLPKPCEPERIMTVVNAALLNHRPARIPVCQLHVPQTQLTRLTAALSQKAAQVVPRLEALISLGLRLASERDPQRLLSDLCSAASKIIEAKASIVQVGGPNIAHYQGTQGVLLGSQDSLVSFHTGSLAQQVRRQRSAQRMGELPGDPAFVGLPAVFAPVISVLCAPIQSPQRVYGWLTLVNRIGARQFSDEDETLAQLLAAQVGRIYENGSLYREVKSYAERLEAEILERRQAQEELRAFTAQLEERIAQRTAELTQLNTELETFGYSVSHDLRAPLRAMQGYSSRVLELDASGLSVQGRQLLLSGLEAARRMGHMVDDLLAFSRLGRQALQSVRLDMTALVRSVWEELVSEDKQPVHFMLEDLPLAFADPGMLRQVWANLLSNALKYSSKNPRRAISVLAVVLPQETQYCVSDNGVGFDMAYAHKLFGVFERLHTEQEFSGTGAGLAIVERIVLRHGGRVWAEAAPGQGATFHFTLPRAATPPLQSQH